MAPSELNGTLIRLTGELGQSFSAWHCNPQEARRGALVILHAIWGVTPHIRSLSQQMAQAGYEVLAPSLLDGLDPFPTRDLDPAILKTRMAMGEASGWGLSCLPIVQACIDHLQGPVFLMGFCFGGTMAWLSATGCSGLSAAACFYGGHIHGYRDRTPRCPTIMHFGRQDETITAQEVADIASCQPDVPLWQYEAGHAFIAPSGYHEDSARLSMLRTLQLFQRHSGLVAEA